MDYGFSRLSFEKATNGLWVNSWHAKLYGLLNRTNY